MKRKILFLIFAVFMSISVFSQEGQFVYTDLSKALENPEKVIVLDLSNQNLETLPAAVVKFGNLQHLNLKNNKIPHLPPYISELTNLEILDLSNMPSLNIIDTLNKISKLKNLKVLKLKQNNLSMR